MKIQTSYRRHWNIFLFPIVLNNVWERSFKLLIIEFNHELDRKESNKLEFDLKLERDIGTY